MASTTTSRLALAALILALPVCHAQDNTDAHAATQARSVSTQHDTQPKTFEQLDINRDGKLSREEVAADPTWLAGDFDSADTNKDGFLSEAEFAQRQADLAKANAHTHGKPDDPPALDDSKKKGRGG